MDRLRAATAAQHAATEALPLMRKLMSEHVSVADYRAYLAGLARPYRLLEPALHAHCAPATLERLGVRARLPHLERDLAGLNLNPPPYRHAALAAVIRTETDALGGLYVLEGATLGGRVIAAQLRRHLGAAADPLPFHFLGTRMETAPSHHWKHFGLALEAERCAGDDSAEPFVQAAVGIFQIFYDALADSALTG